MDDPPSYEESASNAKHHNDDIPTDAKTPQRFSIREEVGVSRTQHVAALVSKLFPQIRSRAKQGLSKSNILLLPSNQDCSQRGQLVGFPEDEVPILIQLEGRQDTVEFWTQEDALQELRMQMLAAISDKVPQMQQPTLPERPRPPPPAKSSFFGRKSSKLPGIRPETQTSVSPVTVDVTLDEVHFRSETEYGLYETLRGRGVLVSIVVR